MKKMMTSPLFAATMALLLCLAALQVLLPHRAWSDMENRRLATLDAPTLQSVRTGSWMRQAETYVADQFPGRDPWMQLQALEDAALLRNVRGGMLVGRDGWLFEACANLDLRTAQANMQTIGALAEAIDVPVTAMVVQLSSALYPDKLPAGYSMDDPQAIAQALYAEAAPAQAVEPFATRDIAACVGPLYYRTDHHWRMEGATAAYLSLLEAWGIAYVPGQTTLLEEPGFCGSYFSRAPSPLVQADTLTFAWPEGITLTIDGEAKPTLYDPVQLAARDKYAALLWGNHGHVQLRGPGQGTLLVIKDSYANALLPLLAQHFETIEIIDPRYFAGDILRMIEETEAESVLCLYGLTTLLTDRNLLLHSAAWDA